MSFDIAKHKDNDKASMDLWLKVRRTSARMIQVIGALDEIAKRLNAAEHRTGIDTEVSDGVYAVGHAVFDAWRVLMDTVCESYPRHTYEHLCWLHHAADERAREELGQ
jgi:hypothetical protein